jgi:hypothetical protein
MFLAAFASLRDPKSKAFYDRKRAESKKHNAALICLARRRCDVILAMLRDHERYQRSGRSAKPPARLPGLRDYRLTRTWGHPLRGTPAEWPRSHAPASNRPSDLHTSGEDNCQSTKNRSIPAAPSDVLR